LESSGESIVEVGQGRFTWKLVIIRKRAGRVVRRPSDDLPGPRLVHFGVDWWRHHTNDLRRVSTDSETALALIWGLVTF
jgi:hypothetical protein